MKLFRYVYLILLLCLTQNVWADVVLDGAINVGDNDPNTTLNPESFLDSNYAPVNPIHFSLTQSTTITGIKLNNGSGASYPLSFIIWDSNGNAVVPAKLSTASNPYVISGNWVLPAGDYRMAVWGQCIITYGRSFSSIWQYDSQCGSSSWLGYLYSSEWDDISFSGITLIGATSSSFNFIQRQHIGDNSGILSRWFPSNQSGMNAVYEFTLNTPSILNQGNFFRMRDVGVDNLSYAYIRKKGTTQSLISTYLKTDDPNNYKYGPLSFAFAAGTYELVVQTGREINSSDADDISWDDVTLVFAPHPVINHYEIRYPTSQVTCEPASITINACTNSDTASCTLDQTTTSTVTLSAPASSGFTNPITLTNGTATIALNHYAAGSVTLGLTNSTAFSCVKNDSPDPTCQLPFVSSAFSFNIPTFYAGRNSGNVAFKAVQASTSNPAVCTPLFAGKTQSINFTNQFVLPPTAGSESPKLNNVAITTNTPVSLTFDNNGAASMVMTYNDAGVLGISAAYSKTDASAGTLNIAGSDNVAVLPDNIKLTAVGQTACNKVADTVTADNKNKAYAACNTYKKAGEAFTLSAQAGYLSGSTLISTNNFTPQSTVAKPSLQHALLAPSTGTLSSAWSNTALTFASGTASSTVAEGDVGVYQYQVTPFVPYPSYQDEATRLTVPESSTNWSDPVGRITPAKLQATITASGALTTDTCVATAAASLGYTGQSLRFAISPTLSVTALGSDGVTVMKNYQNYFAKITSTDAASSGDFIAALLPKNAVNSLTSVATWAAGAWSVPVNAYTPVYTFAANDQFMFNKTNAPVSPFETGLTVSTLTDSDKISATPSLPLTFYPTSSSGVVFNVYSGRLMLDNVNAAETSTLTLPFYMQYWNGSAYVLNTADNCSSLNATYLTMNGGSNWSAINLRTNNNVTISATTNATLSPAAVTQGAGAIVFSAPNSVGWVDLNASSTLPLWMQDLSLASGLTPARANFGFYRGNDRIIYRRDVFGGQ
jgi:hypothetical protein